MITTGFIQLLVASGGGFDSNGNPISPSVTTSVSIKANINITKKAYQIVKDGQYKEVSGVIYVNSTDLNPVLTSMGVSMYSLTKIQLLDINSSIIGAFQIHSIDPLSLFNVVKFIVG